MRKLLILTIYLMVITTLSACDTNDTDRIQQPQNTGNDKEDNKQEENMKLIITVGTTLFTATLQNNTAAMTFKKLLPMTITMFDLNNNEKYYELSDNLPTNSFNPGMMEKGDLMLYRSRTLVLFYKSFPTSYNYTHLGKIDDTTGLVEALGSGNATIIFESNITDK